MNPINAELNPICHLLALVRAHHILHVSMIRVKKRLHLGDLSLVCVHDARFREFKVCFVYLLMVQTLRLV